MSEELFSPQDKETRDALVGLLASVRQTPHPISFSEKLTIAELIRKWFVHVLVALAIMGTFLWRCAVLVRQVNDNTVISQAVKDLPERMTREEKKMRKIRPLVMQHEWQVQNGYTNNDLKSLNIKPPEFPEED